MEGSYPRLRRVTSAIEAFFLITFYSKTPKKQDHIFSAHPSTNHPADRQSLSASRLAEFIKAPASTPLGTGQTSQTPSSRITSQLNDILHHLP